jgi:sortase B
VDHWAVFWQTFSVSLLDEMRARHNNNDIVAYIVIPGTNVGNVVEQGHDNEYYLYRNASRNLNQNGALFMDFQNTPDFRDPNTVIYGHNMRNGSMFADLRHYMHRWFFDRHPNIIIITDHNIFIYEVFSTFSAHVDFHYIQVHFRNRGEFNDLVQEIIRRRAFNTGINPTGYDHILTLSTCTNVHEDTRFVVVGRLAQVVPITEHGLFLGAQEEAEEYIYDEYNGYNLNNNHEINNNHDINDDQNDYYEND